MCGAAITFLRNRELVGFLFVYLPLLGTAYYVYEVTPIARFECIFRVASPLALVGRLDVGSIVVVRLIDCLLDLRADVCVAVGEPRGHRRVARALERVPGARRLRAEVSLLSSRPLPCSLRLSLSFRLGGCAASLPYIVLCWVLSWWTVLFVPGSFSFCLLVAHSVALFPCVTCVLRRRWVRHCSSEHLQVADELEDMDDFEASVFWFACNSRLLPSCFSLFFRAPRTPPFSHLVSACVAAVVEVFVIA